VALLDGRDLSNGERGRRREYKASLKGRIGTVCVSVAFYSEIRSSKPDVGRCWGLNRVA